MTLDWTPLDKELSLWKAEALRLPLWWRDDDAIEPTEPLHRLSDLSAILGLPVHLAVIPAAATSELAEFLQSQPQMIPVVHGWQHRNLAAEGQKKCEFPEDRPIDQALLEMETGLSKLQELLGPSLQPIFVPPWNRLAPQFLPWMAGIGYHAVSTFTPRKSSRASGALEQINTHLDPIDWKGSRCLVAPEELIHQVAEQLRARRVGEADNQEPYGILTHHLVHDESIWDFTEALLTRLLQGPGTVWRFETRTH